MPLRDPSKVVAPRSLEPSRRMYWAWWRTALLSFGSLNSTMPAPIGTYICLCASRVTESAFSIPFNKWLCLSENSVAPPHAASTWKWQPNSLATSASSSKGSTWPVSVVPAIPTMDSTLLPSCWYRLPIAKVWAGDKVWLGQSMVRSCCRPSPSTSTALDKE